VASSQRRVRQLASSEATAVGHKDHGGVAVAPSAALGGGV
jgi:hypothetical protein